MKLQKANFFMLCDVILLVRLQEKFELDHSFFCYRLRMTIYQEFQTFLTCADASGPGSLLRGPDRKKLDRQAVHCVRFARSPDRKRTLGPHT